MFVFFITTSPMQDVNAKKIYEKGLCFPGSTLNSAGDIEHVCEELKKAIREQ